MKIKISSDSTCDLGTDLAEKYDVEILPLSVILGDTKIYRDGIDLTPQDIFDFVAKTGTLPKTCATTVEEYAAYFDRALKENDALIHFNISSKASCTHDNAAVAAERFGGKVSVIDSLALSTGQGLLILKACEMAREGRSPQEIVETVNNLRPKVNTSFVPDSLDYLHKGGRCSLTSMIGAKVLKLHPMIEMRDGQLQATKKYMGGMDRCLKNYVNDLAAEYPNYDRSRCFITHSSCEPEVVAKVREQVSETFSFDEIIETVAGSVITSHCGKGTLGVLFISE
ncbi:MAG: DegV family protein [Candidatus Gallimonas sp.]